MSATVSLIGALLAFSATGCAPRELEESDLVAQLEGGRCIWLSEADPWIVSTIIDLRSYGDDVAIRCKRVKLFDEYSVRSFPENCIASGATCMLALPSVSAKGKAALSRFLLSGPNDVQTGDGIVPIRGAAALVYAMVAGPEALPTLEKAYERGDRLDVTGRPVFLPDDSDRSRARPTKEIKQAIDFLKKGSSH